MENKHTIEFIKKLWPHLTASKVESAVKESVDKNEVITFDLSSKKWVILWARPTFKGDMDFSAELLSELQYLKLKIAFQFDNIFVMDETIYRSRSRELVWASDVWSECQICAFPSIKKASLWLKEQKKVWCHLGDAHLSMIKNKRRGELIGESFKILRPNQRREFSKPRFQMPEYGLYGLLDQNILMSFSKTTAPNPLGQHEFVEDKDGPPSRAYLKIWEALFAYAPVLYEKLITEKANLRCFDLGSSPGGWTWALAKIGVQVTSVDRADLDKKVLNYPNVQFHRESAFGLDPKKIEIPFLLCSDIICYPEKLLELILRWESAGVKNFICTIKFQKETNHAIIDQFLKIANSKIVHLYHNKHEVTFIKY
jgi:23S rRNA (cytidine2498-2'-O)-methyltransferase